MQPLATKRCSPRAAGEGDTGGGLPTSMTFTGSSVVSFALNPLSIRIVHAPASGKLSAAEYSPGLPVGTAVALASA